MTLLSFRIAPLAGILTLLASSGALAESAVRVDPLKHIAPHERRAYVKQLVERQRAVRTNADAATDTTPPVLTAFNAGTKLDLDRADAKFKVVAKATDDMSGVQHMYFYATGPSGQWIYAASDFDYPARSVSTLAGFGEINRFLEPGIWAFTSGAVVDVAGNWQDIDEAGLSALGNRTFTVVNNGGFDSTAPVLTGGKVITAAVSLASHQPGTMQDRFAGVSLSATDAGNGAISGIYRGYATFCQLADTNKCFDLWGGITATGQSTATFTIGRAVAAGRGNEPGEYDLHSIQLDDWAGNSSHLQSNKFGGPVDFSTLFPLGAKITLNP